MLLAGCAVSVDNTDNPSPTPWATFAASPTITEASVAPSHVPAFAPNTAAEVLANDLNVRSDAGVAAAPVPCDRMSGAPVRLEAGDVVWMLADEPVVADGYTWYHAVVHAMQSCTEVPTLPGWIAGGPRDDPWLRPLDTCPAAPTSLGEMAALADQPLLALSCFSRFELTIKGFYPAPPEGGIGLTCPGISPSWLTCGISMLRSDTSALIIRVPPTLTMPAAEQQITVTGHFDDVAAQQCIPADANYVGPVQATFYCRTQFVITSAQPLGSPG